MMSETNDALMMTKQKTSLMSVLIRDSVNTKFKRNQTSSKSTIRGNPYISCYESSS